jgi:hypothetical protein
LARLCLAQPAELEISARSRVFAEFLDVAHILWMDSMFHERLAGDGPSAQIFATSPVYIARWLHPPSDAAREYLSTYIATYQREIAVPMTYKLAALPEYPWAAATGRASVVKSSRPKRDSEMAGRQRCREFFGRRANAHGGPTEFFRSHE